MLIIIKLDLLIPCALKKNYARRFNVFIFLFVLVMKYLNRQLTILSTKIDFKFHLRCAELKITQLGLNLLPLFSRDDAKFIKMT